MQRRGFLAGLLAALVAPFLPPSVTRQTWCQSIDDRHTIARVLADDYQVSAAEEMNPWQAVLNAHDAYAVDFRTYWNLKCAQPEQLSLGL